MARRRAAVPLPSIDDLFTSQEERDSAAAGSVASVPLGLIDPFPNHPFRVADDEDMEALAESVAENGVLVPLTVIPGDGGRYTLVSGHRRKRAAELAGLAEVPCIVREMTEDEAVIAMVDSNLQRESILPSERAFAYSMRLEAMRRQGERTDLTCVQSEHKLKGRKSRDVLAEELGVSSGKVRRYIRLTHLAPGILDDVADVATGFWTNLREGQARLPEPDGRHVAQRRVQPAVVVPVDPVEELRPELLLRSKGPAMRQLALEDPVRRLHHRVVVGVAGPRHRPPYAEGVEHGADLAVAELGPPVAVEDLDFREREGHVGESSLHEARVLPPAARAADDLAVVEAGEQAHVAPRASGADVGEVGRHVGPRRVAVEGPRQDVPRRRGPRRAGAALRRAARVGAREAVLPHDPAYPPPRRGDARPLEGDFQPPGPVPAARRLEGAEHVGPDRVGRLRARRTREHAVVGRAGHAQDLALR